MPDKACARTQLAKRTRPQIRHVWGRAFHHILPAGTFFQPLIKALALFETPIFIGRDIHIEMPHAIIRLIGDTRYTYCFDFSSFDATVCSYLISVAWDIIESLFEMDHHSSMVYDLIRDLNSRSPVIMPAGRLYVVFKGVPSGSYSTQVVDSLVNLILVYAYQLRMFNRTLKTYVMGDDSIFVAEEHCDIEDAANYFASFGMILNSEKSLITADRRQVIFLGHNFYGSRVTRGEFTCLLLALYTEHQPATPENTSIRIS